MLCKMKSVIGNKFASLFQLTKKTSLLASLHELTLQKTHYRWVVPFAKSQKSQQKYVVSKFLSELETFPNN